MTRRRTDFSGDYAAAVRGYLAEPHPRALKQARLLGREARARGLDASELTQAHEAALKLAWPSRNGGGPDKDRARKRAAPFFCEALWSFEAARRGVNGHHDSAQKALHRNQEALDRLTRQVLAAGEEERKRISRDLHDEVGQALTVMHLNLAMAKQLKSPEEFRAKVADLQAVLEQTIQKVEHFARELRPAMIEHLGLVPALQAYVRNFARHTGLRVHLRVEGDPERMAAEEKSVIYRIIQEGLTNVVKHAQAKQATILLRRTNRGLHLALDDNGNGFRAGGAYNGNGRQGLGLLGIQERVRLIDGEFELRAAPGRGTSLRVRIPAKDRGNKTDWH